MEPLATPDITLMQKIVAAVSALVVAGIALVNAFGWTEIDATESAALLGLWTALGGVLVLADAIIRHGRSRAFTMPPKGAVVTEGNTANATVHKLNVRGNVRGAALYDEHLGHGGERVVYREDVPEPPGQEGGPGA
jgi:hypothetical protein